MMMENRDDLILKNTKLIYYVLKKLNLFDKSEELYSVGMIGLVKAANTYKNDFGNAFTTYAYTIIKHEIMRYMTVEFGNKNKANYNTVSLSKVVAIDNNHRVLLEDVIGSDFNIEEDFIYREDVKKLYKCLEKLPLKYKYAILYTYGLFGNEKIKRNEIAKTFNTSPTTVTNYVKRGVVLLRDLMEEDT